MIIYSDKHDIFYDRMATELLQYGGFSAEKRAILNDIRRFAGCTDVYQAEWCDDLYREYGDRDLIE